MESIGGFLQVVSLIAVVVVNIDVFANNVGCLKDPVMENTGESTTNKVTDEVDPDITAVSTGNTTTESTRRIISTTGNVGSGEAQETKSSGDGERNSGEFLVGNLGTDVFDLGEFLLAHFALELGLLDGGSDTEDGKDEDEASNHFDGDGSQVGGTCTRRDDNETTGLATIREIGDNSNEKGTSKKTTEELNDNVKETYKFISIISSMLLRYREPSSS